MNATNGYSFSMLFPDECKLVFTDEEQERFDELWDKYVPGSGSAEPGNHEFLRVVGRIMYELLNNGGGNDESMEINYLDEMLKQGEIPPKMDKYIHFITRFLDDSYKGTFRNMRDYELACAYSFELGRFVMTKF